MELQSKLLAVQLRDPVVEQVISRACASIAADEGFQPDIYDDATGQPVRIECKGNPAIGYGTDLTGGISRAEGQLLMEHYVVTQYAFLSAYPWFKALDLSRKAVILNMGYNMGLIGVLAFVKMIKALNQVPADYTTAAIEILDSKAARQLPGRYKRLSDIMRGQ